MQKNNFNYINFVLLNIIFQKDINIKTYKNQKYDWHKDYLLTKLLHNAI